MLESTDNPNTNTFQTTHEHHTIIRERNDKGKSNGEYTTPQQIKSSTLQ